MENATEEAFELIEADEPDGKVKPNARDMAAMGRSATAVNPSTPSLTRDPSRAGSIARISPKTAKSERSYYEDWEESHNSDEESVKDESSSSPKATGEAKGVPSSDKEVERLVQLAFVLDCTGSMGSYINSAKETILKTAERVQQQCDARVEFGGVMYRDIPPQERTYVTRSFPFTEDKQAFRAFIERQTASGGGDGPEAVASALHKARLLNWKCSKKAPPTLSKADAMHGVIESVAEVVDTSDAKGSVSDVEIPVGLQEVAQDVTRILVFITDAPPHGIGVAGDGFPNGEPIWESKSDQTDGYDPIVEMKELCNLDITSHFVLAEGYKMCQITRSFYNLMASMSQGRAVSLGDASDLIELVSSCAVEARQMDDLAEQLTSMMEKLGKEQPGISKEDVEEQVFRSLSEKAPVVTQISCSELNDDSCLHFRSCGTLDEMRKKSKAISHTQVDHVLPLGFRSLGAVPLATAPCYRGLSAAPSDIDKAGDEDDVAVYRSGESLGALKRGIALHEETRAPPPSPAMRVRSYDATISKKQMQRLLLRVKTLI